MRTCENCGCRVYSLGCTNCDEPAYIEEQEHLTSLPPVYEPSTDDRPRRFADIVPAANECRED